MDTPDGERMQMTVSEHVQDLRAVVVIKRPGRRAETLPLLPSIRHHHSYASQEFPADPHEYDATLQLPAVGEPKNLPSTWPNRKATITDPFENQNG